MDITEPDTRTKLKGGVAYAIELAQIIFQQLLHLWIIQHEPQGLRVPELSGHMGVQCFTDFWVLHSTRLQLTKGELSRYTGTCLFDKREEAEEQQL